MIPESGHTETPPLGRLTGKILNSFLGFQVVIRNMSVFCEVWLCHRWAWGHVPDLIHRLLHNLVMLLMRKETETGALSGTPQPGRIGFNVCFS